MRLLLTSGGVRNDSICAALVELLGKPIEESPALVIPTAQWGYPMCTPESLCRSVSGKTRLVELGQESVGVLELVALPTMRRERWEPWVRQTDVFLVDVGEAVYLAHWLRKSGLADLLPSLPDTV